MRSISCALRPMDITPFRVTLQASALAQAFELAHDLAPVAAAARAHQLDKELRSVGERRLERFEAPPLEARRDRQPRIHSGLQRQIKAGLRAGAARSERRVERHGAE